MDRSSAIVTNSLYELIKPTTTRRSNRKHKKVVGRFLLLISHRQDGKSNHIGFMCHIQIRYQRIDLVPMINIFDSFRSDCR